MLPWQTRHAGDAYRAMQRDLALDTTSIVSMPWAEDETDPCAKSAMINTLRK
jgi:hypothetical protein